jgi:UDP-N-acetylglucosamine diphosphorylase/glucosamine-1-phosphate N-acetyltransferase
MQISFFEDVLSRHFKPLTLTRPVWDLRIGIYTIKEKWLFFLEPDAISWTTHDHLKELFPYTKIDKSSECYYINSRFLPTHELVDKIKALELGEALYHESHLVAYKTKGKTFDSPTDFEIKNKNDLDFKPVHIEYLWDLLDINSSQIKSDIEIHGLEITKHRDIDNVIITHKDNVYISDSATIEPGVILMADKGHIFIGENVVIEAGAVVKGPAALCDNSTVKMRARIYDGTTIGPHCKIGGEVSACIFHSYSNKAHDGYAGNSIFGQWCNLGADSNTSNLKNNYSFVRIQDWETKQKYKYGFQFFGTVMGDHSKTSINTMLSTGTTCGVSSNIFPSGFPPKYIPSFTWVDGEKNPEFKFDKALEVMKAMMARRKVELTPEYEEMMKYIYNKK